MRAFSLRQSDDGSLCVEELGLLGPDSQFRVSSVYLLPYDLHRPSHKDVQDKPSESIQRDDLVKPRM